MTLERKENIQYVTAIVMLVSGMVLTYLSFFRDGDVAKGVLWYTGQAIVYAGSIFGVAMYVNSKGHEIKNYIDKRISHPADDADPTIE